MRQGPSVPQYSLQPCEDALVRVRTLVLPFLEAPSSLLLPLLKSQALFLASPRGGTRGKAVVSARKKRGKC